jgi:signal transduction histidine kinase
VVLNLVTNAIRYGAGKPIDVSVQPTNGAVLIQVKDHGIGIAPEDQARIFERFERGTASRNFGGLGLGLYITRQIVEAHGGTIRVQSAPEMGSTFTVSLPA